MAFKKEYVFKFLNKSILFNTLNVVRHQMYDYFFLYKVRILNTDFYFQAEHKHDLK